MIALATQNPTVALLVLMTINAAWCMVGAIVSTRLFHVKRSINRAKGAKDSNMSNNENITLIRFTSTSKDERPKAEQGLDHKDYTSVACINKFGKIGFVPRGAVQFINPAAIIDLADYLPARQVKIGGFIWDKPAGYVAKVGELATLRRQFGIYSAAPVAAPVAAPAAPDPLIGAPMPSNFMRRVKWARLNHGYEGPANGDSLTAHLIACGVLTNKPADKPPVVSPMRPEPQPSEAGSLAETVAAQGQALDTLQNTLTAMLTRLENLTHT